MATLVAHGVSYEELFAAVGHEVAELVHADATAILRFEPDDTVTLVAAWNAAGVPAPVGERQALDATLRRVRETGCPLHWRPANGPPAGPFGAAARRLGLCAAVGVAIEVDRRVWGVSIAAWQRLIPLTDDIETRMAEFAELVAVTIGNAESRAELAASRTRAMMAADDTRRRIQRDLHDGAQQHLVHTVIGLKLAKATLEEAGDPAADLVGAALENAERAIADLRELVAGITPGALRHGGLRAGVESLVEHIDLAVAVDVVPDRLPPHIETTAYFVLAEALTNAVKHGGATTARVRAAVRDGALEVEVRDDGRGGADPRGGSGLAGLADRVATIGGTIAIASPPGAGTTISARLPAAG